MIPQCGLRAADVCRDRRQRRGRRAPCEKMPPRDGQDMAPLRRATIHDRRTFDSYMGHRHRSETAGLGGFPSAAKRLVERCKLAEPRRARPAWFVDVERDGLLLPIHIRGDRKSDIMPFPELAREAAIMAGLEEHGIPVPHIYGVCPVPEGIIMAAIPGSRDVSTAGADAERR